MKYYAVKQKKVNKPIGQIQPMKGTKTMMKDKIKIQRDVAIHSINESKYLSADDKMYLVELISEAAEGTNGLEPKDKLQNVSETTFNLAILMSRIDDKLNSMSETMQKFATKKEDTKSEKLPATWNDMAKMILLKPWAYITACVLAFSPHCAEIIKTLMSLVERST